MCPGDVIKIVTIVMDLPASSITTFACSDPPRWREACFSLLLQLITIRERGDARTNFSLLAQPRPFIPRRGIKREFPRIINVHPLGCHFGFIPRSIPSIIFLQRDQKRSLLLLPSNSRVILDNDIPER